jgi:hypothetical protein
MLVSLLISLAIIIVLCCLLNIDTKEIVVVCIISVLIIGVLDRFFNLDQKVNNMMINNNIPVFSNSSNLLNQKNEFVGSKNNQKAIKVNSVNCKLNRLNANSIDQIIKPEMYNQDDCTTDMTCIQKPDENNLFVGFAKNQDTINKIKKLDFEISKMENNLKTLASDDRIVTEHFHNNHTPHEINDLVQPFNKSVIKPYNTKSNQKDLDSYNMMETGGICFHCKVGTCEGGVCKSISQLEVPATNSHNDNNKLIEYAQPMDTHPYSINQPVIQVTNPGQHDFR